MQQSDFPVWHVVYVSSCKRLIARGKEREEPCIPSRPRDSRENVLKGRCAVFIVYRGSQGSCNQGIDIPFQPFASTKCELTHRSHETPQYS